MTSEFAKVHQIHPLGQHLDSTTQSHYREVTRWEISMEQELKFGLDLGWFCNFWGRVFHVFMGKFFLKNIVDGENIFGIEWSLF